MLSLWPMGTLIACSKLLLMSGICLLELFERMSEGAFGSVGLSTGCMTPCQKQRLEPERLQADHSSAGRNQYLEDTHSCETIHLRGIVVDLETNCVDLSSAVKFLKDQCGLKV